MAWTLEETLEYYRRQGAPADQNALISLLKEIQEEMGGAIPAGMPAAIAEAYGIRPALLTAIIRRVPRLRLADTHTLELCGGPNCSRRAQLAAFIENTYGTRPEGFTFRTVPCMRQCGKGPNLRWDGVLYHHADEALVRRLIEGGTK